MCDYEFDMTECVAAPAIHMVCAHTSLTNATCKQIPTHTHLSPVINYLHTRNTHETKQG